MRRIWDVFCQEGKLAIMDVSTQIQPIPPSTCFDREYRQNSNYFFVSYSHKDRSIVFDTLAQLYSLGVNYWYDVDLDPGDIWNERVEQVLRNPHCRGALIFMSVNSLISSAVQQEIKIMEELSEERGFRLVPIIVGFENAKSLVLDVAGSNDGFYQGGGMLLFQKFTVDGIWIKYNEAVESISRLSESENVKEGNSINLKRSFLQEINYISYGGTQSFFCGKYPSDEDGHLQDIEWTLVCNNRKHYYFISKYCIDFVNMKNINTTVESVKNTMVSQKYVEDVAPLNEDFLNSHLNHISDALPSNYADRNRQQLLRLFWVLIDDGTHSHQYSLYNSQNVKIKENIQRDKINAGLRLILTINNEKIGEQ